MNVYSVHFTYELNVYSFITHEVIFNNIFQTLNSKNKMEIDDSAAANEDDLLFAEDGGDAAEYTTGEVDQLLGDDDETEKYYEETGEDQPEHEEGHEEDEVHEEQDVEGNEEEGSGMRGRGGLRRPFMRGMRGGRFMMRGMMMMPPRFFPPMPPGMRPPFMPFMGRPPFGMRGMRPMRMPMLPPPFMRMPFPRFGPPRVRGEIKSSTPATSEAPKVTKSDGPTPLMSIPTPEPLKVMLETQHHPRGGAVIGMGMGPQYHAMRGGIIAASLSTMRGGATTRLTTKRPAASNGAQSMKVDYGEPKAKVPSRSNLTFIRTVDESSQKPVSYYQKPAPPPNSYTHSSYPTAMHYPSSSASHYASGMQPMAQSYSAPRFVVSHKPAPNLTQIQLTPSDPSAGSIKPVPAIRGVKVMIWNLPPSAHFAEVSAMTTSCGSVRTLNVRKENNTAIIEFSNGQSAEHFIRLHNNTIMAGCLLTVNKI